MGNLHFFSPSSFFFFSGCKYLFDNLEMIRYCFGQTNYLFFFNRRLSKDDHGNGVYLDFVVEN